MRKIRTTIVLPEEDIRLVKMLAASSGLTMSEVVQNGIRQVTTQSLKKEANKRGNKREGFWKLAGSLNLGGKEPPTRQEIYDRYLKEKFSR